MKHKKAHKFTMAEFLGTMAEWIQRNNGKSHITYEVNGRNTTRKLKK